MHAACRWKREAFLLSSFSFNNDNEFHQRKTHIDIEQKKRDMKTAFAGKIEPTRNRKEEKNTTNTKKEGIMKS